MDFASLRLGSGWQLWLVAQKGIGRHPIVADHGHGRVRLLSGRCWVRTSDPCIVRPGGIRRPAKTGILAVQRPFLHSLN